ncbi:MAG: EAL domain-containing protein [Motiliproteus sp.]
MPILLVSHFAIQAFMESWQQTQVMERIQRHSQLAVAANGLVHEIQKERGLSAGYVGGSGRQLNEELVLQRILVDETIDSYKYLIQHLTRNNYDLPIASQVRRIVTQIDDFTVIRDRVDRLDIDLAELLEKYTARNTALLSLVSTIAANSDSTDISNQTSAYFFLSLSKEQAGIERAVLSHAFARGTLDAKLRQKFHALLSEQSAYLKLFNEYAGEPERTIAANILDSTSLTRFREIENIALERAQNFGVSAKDWFEVATERINLLKRAENELSTRLNETVNRHQQNAFNKLVLVTVVSLFSILFTLVLSLIIVRAINNQLKELFRAVSKVDRDSDLSARAQELSDDELGRLAGSFNQMLAHLADAEGKVRMLSQALEQSPVSVIITDLEGHIEYVNQTFQTVSGYSAEEVLGQNTSMLKSGKTHPRIYQSLWQDLCEGKSWEGEFQNRRKDQSILWESVHISPVSDEKGTVHHYLAVKNDITEAKRQSEKITYQANFDALTGLPNRFLSLDRLSQLLSSAQRRSKKVAVLFLDLDDFKKINDTLGHESGDCVLIQTAERLKTVIRSEDTVGRLGGDEFLLLLRDIDNEGHVQSVVEQVQAVLEQPFVQNGRELVISSSIGIAMYPQDGETAAALLRNADAAMYASKRAGRSTFHYFTESMNRTVTRQLVLEEQLHGALERDEFFVCFQPLVCVETQHIMGAEALLRWNNPALGMVSPEEFITVAEHSETIVHLGLFVLDKALEVAACWRRDHHPDFQIAVNVSPRQFRNRQFPDEVKKALERHQLPGSALELEITEGVLMNRNMHLDGILEDLQGMDIGISMDDFGTGYSSLSYLRSYPFSCLKIDRSFISDISVDPADRELVAAAISMGHGLGLKIVAEGVETDEQLKYLRQQGCDIGQGYLFGKPVIAEEFEKALLIDAVDSPFLPGLKVPPRPLTDVTA